ncbi:MAG: bacterial/archaeal transporter family-2 protein [Desulfovibrionales bacterium]|jgi:transporter family-2 protein|nr:bacterial/archaeal transporter family-2 protein [Desulfovibrionales bacterium]
MRFALLALALLAGGLMPVQAGINARLKFFLGDPAWAALASFAVGTLALLVYCSALLPWPTAANALKAPLWTWTGGFLGAFFVAATIFMALKLGAASMMAWLIAGQLISSLLLDQFGMVGFAARGISIQRVLGALLLLAGALLIEKY